MNKIQELYENPKSKGFINHLIQSYLPIYKTTKVFEFEDKKPHKCNVCSHNLIDLGTVMGKMYNSEEYMHDTIEHMKKQILGEEIKKEDNPVIKHITHGAIMAWQGKNTTTFLCQDCIQELLEFTTNELLRVDQNISYQLNKLKRTEVFNSFTESPKLDESEKNKS